MDTFGGSGTSAPTKTSSSGGSSFSPGTVLAGKYLLLTIIYVSTIVIAIILLALSFSQLKRKGTDADFCKAVKHPYRVVFSGGDTVVCPWDTNNSAARIAAYFFSIAIAATTIFFVIGKKNKIAFWVLWIIGVLEFIFLFYVFVSDAKDLNDANKQCKDLESGFSDGGHCKPGPYTATAVLDFLAVIWLANTALLGYANFKWKLIE